MIHSIILVIAILVGGLLPSQSIPYKTWTCPNFGSAGCFTILPSEVVGSLTWGQPSQAGQVGFADGSFWLGNYSNTATPWGTTGTNAVGVGGQYVSSMLTILPQYRQHNSYIPFWTMALTNWPSAYNTTMIGPVAPGWNQLLVDPSSSVTIMAQWYAPVQAFNYTFDAFSCTLDVPNNINLFGICMETQWMRVDPVDGLIYLAPRMSTFIGL